MANAGSGKTTRLTARVVRLLLMGVPAERIVCITYTKAAANEMRARVLKELRTLLLADDTGCQKMIEKLLDVPASDEQVRHARSLFASVLDSSAGGLQLTTIHGFCQNILRRFPIEADIAPHFTVLEDAAADDVLRRAKLALLSGIDTADKWLRDAIELIGNRGGETRFETIANHIIATRRVWKRVWNGQDEASLKAHLFHFHGLGAGATRASLDVRLCDALSDSQEAGLRAELPAMLSHTKKTEQKYGAGIARWLEVAGEERIARIPALLQLILTKGALRADIQKLTNYEPHIAALAQAVLRYNSQRAALACAEETFAVAVLARNLLLNYEAAKIATHALDYDDLIDRTLALVTAPEMIGWVMSKLDHRIDHLLIDEAQDNSPEQWKLAHILVEELIASNDGVGSAGHPRSLLVVGDEKQSIYSFQGAAPEEFHRYQGAFDAMLAGSPSPLTRAMLKDSWRSTAAVLKLVDTVCAGDVMCKALSAAGEIAQHVLQRNGEPGRVVLYPPIIAPEKLASEPLIIPTEYHIAASAPQQLAEHIAETIESWLKDDVRGVRAGDILILVHRRKPLVQPLIRALQRRGIPVAGIDRLKLAGHLAVTDLLALMRWCVNVGDDLALAQVLRSPLIGLSDEQLRELAYGRAGNLWAQVNEPWLAQLRQMLNLTPYDFLTHVLEVSGRREQFAKRFGEEVHEVLDELKAQAAAMPAGLPCSIAHFVDFMANNAREVKREQEAANLGHVRIMTVHGAKGLEAPVVILADTVSVPDTGREVSFSMKSPEGQELPIISLSAESKDATRRAEAKDRKLEKLLAEYNRLLYVALTRARDELHIFGTASKKGEVKRHSWYETVSTAMRGIAEEQGELLVYSDGVDATPKKKAAAHPERTTAPAWLHVRAAQEFNAAATLSPSGLEQAEISPYAAPASSGARERGVRIHRILELLRSDASEQSISQLIAHIAPDWNAATKAEIHKKLMQLVHEHPAHWQGERFTEVNVAGSIAYEGENIAFSGQIDLLVKTATEIIVIDYKTGAHVPKNTAEVSRNYLLQLKIYRELVGQIYPGLPVRCAILWTHTAQLMWLDTAVQGTQFPDKQAMLKTIMAA